MPIMARSTVINDSFGGLPSCNEALQCLKKSPVGSDMPRMNQMGFSADENVCTGEASIDSRCIGLNFVHQKIIIQSRYIHSRMRGSKPLKKITMLRLREGAILSRILKGLLDKLSREPAKEGLQDLIINLRWCMLSWSRQTMEGIVGFMCRL